ncbi:S-layer homology domain-containing protein [Oscillatoria salina]|uniref:S-layer homology domain-containing protein n=1 Tax=Oscillatoria salina TaxID=331517 RepID=UPI001CCCF202|nr:S-layer homology domain-containing protein [Oscillatoria salina]
MNVLLNRFLIVRLTLGAIVLASLSSCSGGDAEKWFAADPQLKENQPVIASSPETDRPTQSTTKLPDDFPQQIPLYPQAKILNVKSEDTLGKVQILWASAAPSNEIEQFYQEQFQSDNWEIVQEFTAANNSDEKTAIARQGELQVKVAVASPTSESSSEAEGATTFALEYQQGTNVATAETENPEPEAENTTTESEFTDLEQIPEITQKYIQDLANLGVFDLDGNFEPNKTITRREYVEWLVKANNLFYQNNPGKQVRLSSTVNQPAFADVPTSDPGFPEIQGLAEAGIIPSRLTGDGVAVQFRPNAPLTREALIAWKVPLDSRSGLPTASIEAIEKTWGFQDAAKIDPKVQRSLLADFQNGEQANVRRVFGYTTLFQPQKPVTRAEAATALWYFGYQGEGISAADVSTN